MLGAGRLNQRVAFSCPVETFDEQRSRSVSWQPRGEVWAAVEAITGREVHVAAQLHSVVSHRMTIRQPGPRPTAKWRAVWDCRVLSIEAVLPHQDRDRLVLVCSEGLNEG